MKMQNIDIEVSFHPLNLQKRSCKIPVLTICVTMHTLNMFSNIFCYIEIHMSILKLCWQYREWLYTRWHLIVVVLHLSFCRSDTKQLFIRVFGKELIPA